MTNNRKEILRQNGIDTNKFFTVIMNEDLPKGSKISVEVAPSAAEAVQQIKENGYVKNTKLHRRFIMAHYMRMLNHKDGWYEALRTYYPYMYQLDMMTEEIRVLSILQKKDFDTYNERRSFFKPTTIGAVLDDYFRDVRQYVSNLPTMKCKGRPYKKVPGQTNVFEDELEAKIFTPLRNALDNVKSAYSYEEKYYALKAAKRRFVRLPADTRKSKAWINAFQSAGAYYTLKNMVMYHDCDLPLRTEDNIGYAPVYQNTVKSGEDAVKTLKSILFRHNYEGYQWHALLKETVKVNNFDFAKSISKQN